MPEKWISPPQYALRYGLHRRTVLKWIRQGRVRSVRRGKDYLVLDPGILEVANPLARIITEKDVAPIFRGTEVAEMLGITPRALRLYSQGGRIGYTTKGGKRRYSIRDVREIIALRTMNATRASRSQVRKSIVEWGKERLGLQ